MLKKFLKFLRGDGEDSEALDQSYLNELLRSVQPRVVEKLEECPQHDPLPLLVAEIVGEVDRQRFKYDLDSPVTDPQSPGLDPKTDDATEGEEPEPPPPPGAEPSEDADGVEKGEEDDTAADTDGESEESSGEQTAEDDDEEPSGNQSVEGSEDSEGDLDVQDEGETESGEGSEAGGETQKSGDLEEETAPIESGESEGEGAGDETDSGQIDDGTSNSDTASSDETDEFFETQEEDTDVEYDEPTTVETAADRVSERAGRVVDESGPDEAPSVDSTVVLEMGRVFLGMLSENDALPVELQLSSDEIDDARQLLYGYFLGDELVNDRAREMLRRVENKFDEGLFSQARILLQLFDADKQTRIENDRNLFYEEMILRFGIQRRHPVGDDVVDRFEERIERFDGSEDALEELLVWLSQSVYVTFDLYARNEREVEEWREIAGLSERPGATERLLEVVPPERWRLLDEFQRPAATLVEERMTSDLVEKYVKDHVKTCYFILRAVGDTGLEPYLDVFFDWAEREFGVDAAGLMPWLYVETTANERLIDDIFHELYVEHFESEVEATRREWESDAIEAAVESVIERVGATELGDIPPGHYDFGHFVLDELFEIEYPSAEFPFKMHRIT